MPYQEKDCAGKPFRPSNGTEGEIFQEEWCSRCVHDRAFQDAIANGDPGYPDGCEIVARTFVHEIDDPQYPKEWTHDDEGRPCCTAFVRADD